MTSIKPFTFYSLSLRERIFLFPLSLRERIFPFPLSLRERIFLFPPLPPGEGWGEGK
jgi:hypothetical protein